MAAILGIPGLSVGHFGDPVAATGCTVVLAPSGVIASVDIRGGAPGTLETALLSPYASVGEIHGVMLTGGSAPGLGAAAGVTCYLRERGYGYRTPFARVPLVAAGVIYDLGVGSASGCPRPEDAYAAAAAAGNLVQEGSVGAGTGASVGKILGAAGMMKGALAMASVMVGAGGEAGCGAATGPDGGTAPGAAHEAVTVTALTVVNALGDILDERGGILAGARRQGRFVNSQKLLLQLTAAPIFNAMESTTLSVVMTDAKLDKLQCGIVARMSHDGFARAICPVHTPVDGDCVFVLATGEKPSNVFQIGAAAAEAVAMSIRRAVRVAEGREGVPSVADLAGGADAGPPA